MTESPSRNAAAWLQDIRRLLAEKGIEPSSKQQGETLNPPASSCEQAHWVHVRFSQSHLDCRLCRGVS